jgi:4-amino-4-deoxy-L-arabinose transferase-like glycosyltransferase
MQTAKTPGAAPRDFGFDWFAKHPGWLLAIVSAIVFLPFLSKPFNIDDPLFIWTARHIQSHPLDPYGFDVNWYGYNWSVANITKNPPFACYYLSIAGTLLGWSEPALHAALLLPMVAVVLGSYRLASHFCKRPLLAAVLTLFAPAFLLSSTTIMCDVMMLAFWVWALVCWIEGAEKKDRRRIALAAVFITLASLTKYFGASLIPLVAAWSIAGKRPLRQWAGWLAVPIAALVAYQFITRQMYGHGLLSDAGAYATVQRGWSLVSNVRSCLVGLSFTGGCIATAVFFTPLLWPCRKLLIGTAVSLGLIAAILFGLHSEFPDRGGNEQTLQVAFWALGGINLLALAISDFSHKRSADSLLLGCWMLGTFVFTVFCNWIINGRSILPMTIPAAILVARRLDERASLGVIFSKRALLIPGVAGAVLAIWVAAADYMYAAAAQSAAEAVQTNYGRDGHRVWFQGHWGFQYYMEKAGATAFDFQHPRYPKGDYGVIPSANSNVHPFIESAVEAGTVSVPIGSWLSTMSARQGAGFYASQGSPLPFALGPVPDQSVGVFLFDPQAPKIGGKAEQPASR